MHIYIYTYIRIYIYTYIHTNAFKTTPFPEHANDACFSSVPQMPYMLQKVLEYTDVATDATPARHKQFHTCCQGYHAFCHER